MTDECEKNPAQLAAGVIMIIVAVVTVGYCLMPLLDPMAGYGMTRKETVGDRSIYFTVSVGALLVWFQTKVVNAALSLGMDIGHTLNDRKEGL